MKFNVIRGLTTLFAIVLTAKLGTIQFNDHRETWYNLRMDRIVERADAYYGLHDVYAVREDGVKTYNELVIVAADWNLHPYGTFIETSLGTGIVLDTHTAKDRTIVDIATTWGITKKERQ
jgi:hypothetical protein